MSAETKAPAPRANEERAEQSPSRESVVFNVPPTVEQCERVARLRRLEADEASRKASRELDSLIEQMNGRPLTDADRLARNESITRRTANDLVMLRGFDPEYVAALYGLKIRAGVSV